jgi:hypothetical protein
VELLPTLISTGWASGVNAWGTVLVLGLLGRAGVGEVPDELQQEPILIGAGVMYAIEFITDKVPFLDNTWDFVSTFIRPVIGSTLGVEFADLDQAGTVDQVLAGGGTGATALTSHAIKSALRLGINASPEPLSNILVSLAEDAAVAGVVALALENPVPAAIIALLLMATGIALVIFIWKRIRRAYGRWKEYRRTRGHAGREPPPE